MSPDLLGEGGVLGALEGAEAVRLEAVSLPDALNGAQRRDCQCKGRFRYANLNLPSNMIANCASPWPIRAAAGDSQALLALISDLRKKVAAKLGVQASVVSCFEAGRDGFWLRRLLSEHGVSNHVADEHSGEPPRKARQNRSARCTGLLRILAAHAKGDHDVCSVVSVPTIEEEDAKRQHREREHLVQERVRIENRIATLLTTQGIRKNPSLRSLEKDMEEMRPGDGRPIPSLLRPEVNRLRRRLVMTLEMIREVQAEREQALQTQDDMATDGVRPMLEADHKVIDVAHQSGFAPQPLLRHAFEPEVEHVMKYRLLKSTLIDPPCGVPLSLGWTAPSSRTPAFNQRRIRLIRRGSPTRCSTNRSTQSWLRLPKKFFKSASSTQLILPQR